MEPPIPTRTPSRASVAELRQQAQVLRGLAQTFDIADIHLQLIALAERCDNIAATLDDLEER